MTKVRILPSESFSGTTILNDRENITTPTCSTVGIFIQIPLKIVIKVSSPTLCKSSITIKLGELFSPLIIKSTAIFG